MVQIGFIVDFHVYQSGYSIWSNFQSESNLLGRYLDSHIFKSAHQNSKKRNYDRIHVQLSRKMKKPNCVPIYVYYSVSWTFFYGSELFLYKLKYIFHLRFDFFSTKFQIKSSSLRSKSTKSQIVNCWKCQIECSNLDCTLFAEINNNRQVNASFSNGIKWSWEYEEMMELLPSIFRVRVESRNRRDIEPICRRD